MRDAHGHSLLWDAVAFGHAELALQLLAMCPGKWDFTEAPPAEVEQPVAGCERAQPSHLYPLWCQPEGEELVGSGSAELFRPGSAVLSHRRCELFQAQVHPRRGDTLLHLLSGNVRGLRLLAFFVASECCPKSWLHTPKRQRNPCKYF